MFRVMDQTTPGCTTNIGGFTDVPSLGCLAIVIINVINLAFMFLGAVTLLMLLWGAIQFTISRGDAKAVQSAQKTMTFAIIGAVVVLLVFALINFVTSTLGLPNILANFTLFQGQWP